jgi:DNA-binding GntR family transcriptional regulator
MDADFHEIISKFIDSKYLMEFTEMMRRHMIRYRIESFENVDIVSRAFEGHKRVLHAIKNGNYTEVEKVLHEHIDISLKDILKSVGGEKTKRKS